MRLLFSIILFACLPVIVRGQSPANPIVNQFMISLNRTLESNYSTENRYGFGLGAYHAFLPDKTISFNTGIEFNRTRQLKRTELIGHFGEYNDLLYSKNAISVPLNISVSLGKKKLCFFEAGAFWDWVISSKQKGIFHTFIPDGNGQIQHKYYEVTENADLVNSFGISFGIGMRIPYKEFDIIIKPAYKHKFNKWYYEEDRVLSKYWRLNLGIALK